MKKHAVTLLILMVISLPGLLNAQSARVTDAQSGNQTVLVISGGQQLTQLQADCALELVDYMAAAVRGVDLIQVDEPMRQIWRMYLANLYSRLPQEDRTFLANAPTMFYNVNVMWPQLTPAAQNTYRQTWGPALQPMLQFIQPVVTAARQQQAWQVANAGNNGTSYRSTGSQAADPVTELNRQAQIADSLAVHNYKMNIYTTDLMHSMNQMSH